MSKPTGVMTKTSAKTRTSVKMEDVSTPMGDTSVTVIPDSFRVKIRHTVLVRLEEMLSISGLL